MEKFLSTLEGSNRSAPSGPETVFRNFFSVGFTYGYSRFSPSGKRSKVMLVRPNTLSRGQFGQPCNTTAQANGLGQPTAKSEPEPCKGEILNWRAIVRADSTYPALQGLQFGGDLDF
jgi:hypothetical protein